MREEIELAWERLREGQLWGASGPCAAPKLREMWTERDLWLHQPSGVSEPHKQFWWHVKRKRGWSDVERDWEQRKYRGK